MTRAKKQLSKRDDMGPGNFRKSMHLQDLFPGQSDFRARQNAGLGEEDVLEVHDDKDDSLPEDLRAVSLPSPSCI